AAVHAEQERIVAQARRTEEEERLAAQHVVAERLAAMRAEEERLAAVRVEQEQLLALARGSKEEERLAAQRAEAEREAAQYAEEERRAAHVEQERQAAESRRQEEERLAAVRAEEERLAAEARRQEEERLAGVRAEEERRAAATARRDEEQSWALEPYRRPAVPERPRHAATVDLWSAAPREGIRAEVELRVVAEGPYGQGSAYVVADGSAPQGFSIKGNEATKLFHTERSRYFTRAQADVWFDTEEAAESAGFMRWDRRGTLAHEVLQASRPGSSVEKPSDVA
ncbi:MAG: hypothetical protein QOK15_848, partial [Nocardioidaceae bacterium]|nr:hypothetical protein [Nocardioidaceae bacterium]